MSSFDSAATLILNDDVDGAEAGLDKGVSSFHKVCARFPHASTRGGIYEKLGLAKIANVHLLNILPFSFGGVSLLMFPFCAYSWERASLRSFVQH